MAHGVDAPKRQTFMMLDKSAEKQKNNNYNTSFKCINITVIIETIFFHNTITPEFQM